MDEKLLEQCIKDIGSLINLQMRSQSFMNATDDEIFKKCVELQDKIESIYSMDVIREANEYIYEESGLRWF